jgi:hypothetical protein
LTPIDDIPPFAAFKDGRAAEDNGHRGKVSEPGNKESKYENQEQFVRKKPRVQDPEDDDGGFGFGGSGGGELRGDYAQGYEEDDGELRADNTGFDQQRAQ